ncbi:helix-turn-helix transcriptional regulator [Parasphingopyxis marina]|uniref:Helix-turn-helix transcriptional regulator n=1 Tax=Parasphingopyxis marina TaxID=2761622 RepID=A0A842HXP1_9SPHN|nr:AraC family transcriptional regulator [Parasphingopyxis marina]MBC2777197.1 helix-turn-helix transcriptional regulator [Parasphingopyxis marina]
MQETNSLEFERARPSERGAIIGDMLSSAYSSDWTARLLDRDDNCLKVGGETVDGIGIASASLPPLSIRNDPPPRRKERKYYIYVADQVQKLELPDGEALILNPEQLTVLSSDMPIKITIPKPYRTTSLIIDRDIFETSIPCSRILVGRRLTFPDHVNSVLKEMLESAFLISHAGKFGDAAPHLARSFLEYLLMSIHFDKAIPADSPNALEFRRKQVMAYIEQNFGQPELSVEHIARRLGVSARYVQMAFAGFEMSPSQCIKKCRLEATAKRLRDPQWSGISITEISFRCGFNSSAHFSNEFRKAYGMAPREYRLAPTTAAN